MSKEISSLKRALEAVADPSVKIWFENYLKGAIAYRGVKTPTVKKIVTQWARDNGIPARPLGEQLAVVDALFSGEYAEDKFAGTLYLQIFLKKADPDAILDLIEGAFVRGAFFDWSSTDWLCVRVIDPLIIRHGDGVAERVASWANAADFWQRRASIVSFRHASADPEYSRLIERVIGQLVVDKSRFIQTGIGWVIADWSKKEPVAVAALIERHFDRISREVIDRHTKYLLDHKAYKAEKRRAES